MTRTDAQAFLTELFSSTPAVTATMITTALDASRVVDSEGRAPSDADYVETIDQWWAAAEIADMLTIQQMQAGGVAKFSSEGSSFELAGPDWASIGAHYRSKSPLGVPAGVGVIEIDSGNEFLPRSLREDLEC